MGCWPRRLRGRWDCGIRATGLPEDRRRVLAGYDFARPRGYNIRGAQVPRVEGERVGLFGFSQTHRKADGIAGRGRLWKGVQAADPPRRDRQGPYEADG